MKGLCYNGMNKKQREDFDWKKRKRSFFMDKSDIDCSHSSFFNSNVYFCTDCRDGESMMPTLQDHERIVLTKFGTNIDNIDRFDIVVFHATVDKDYIKGLSVCRVTILKI